MKRDGVDGHFCDPDVNGMRRGEWNDATRRFAKVGCAHAPEKKVVIRLQTQGEHENVIFNACQDLLNDPEKRHESSVTFGRPRTSQIFKQTSCQLNKRENFPIDIIGSATRVARARTLWAQKSLLLLQQLVKTI
jgi:hypothetical protein